MNKKLIKKYKNEFDHWLIGGSILAANKKYLERDGWDVDVDFVFESSHQEYLVVINDEYVEFRKALAESKTLQWLNHSNWENLQNATPSFEFSCCIKYRIKPEELKFKVGDTIRHEDRSIGIVRNLTPLPNLREVEVDWKIDRNGKYIEEFSIGKHKTNKLKLWQPQEDEWCLFWDDSENYAIIDKFIKVRDFDKFYKTASSAHWQNCQPYFGPLPDHLKDN